MSELTDKLHVTAVGALCPADIGGDACDGCPHNKVGEPGVLLTGCTKEAATLLFEDCRIVPAGADDEPETDILLEQQAKRIKELEAENSRLWEAIRRTCGGCWYGKADDPAQCRLCGLREIKMQVQ